MTGFTLLIDIRISNFKVTLLMGPRMEIFNVATALAMVFGTC